MSPTRPLPPTHTHHNSSTQKIPQAKQDIYNFSIQIVKDINHLAEVFGENDGGRLSEKACEDLQTIGEVVNDIYEWAHKGLVSFVFCQSNRVVPVPDIHSKQSSLRNTLTAEEKMKEFRDKLMDIRSKFMVGFLYLDKII